MGSVYWKKNMSKCCVCDGPVNVSVSGAMFCGAEHASLFCNNLRDCNKKKVIANQPLSEHAIKCNSIRSAFEFNIGGKGVKLEVDERPKLHEVYKDIQWIKDSHSSKIYRAVNIQANNVVDIKVFDPKTPMTDVLSELNNITELREELEDYEDELLRNVILIFGAHTVQTQFYNEPSVIFVMEHIDGISLKDFMRRSTEKITMQYWISMFSTLFKVLDEMHATGIAHRDLNLDTIMVRQAADNVYDLYNLFTNAVITEFGGSCTEQTSHKFFPAATIFQGPDLIGYPYDLEFQEKILGMTDADRLELYKKEDVYALAMVLFVVLSGQRSTYLQNILHNTELEFFNTMEHVDKNNENAVARLDIKRRNKLRRKFSEKKLLHDVDYIIGQNPNLSKESDYESVFYLYQWTIGAWAEQRATTSRVISMAIEVERKYAFK